MMKQCLRADKLVIIQIFLIYCWFVNLAGSNSFYSIYVLLALWAMYCLLTKKEHLQPLTRRECVCIYAVSSLFSLAMILENYYLFSYYLTASNVIRASLCFLGGCCVGGNLLGRLLQRPALTKPACADSAAKEARTVFTSVAGGAAALHTFYLMTAAYPGVLSVDSIKTMDQILTGTYNNIMPFWHTMTVQLFIQPGLLLFGDINAAIALFHVVQILFMSACFGYAAMTLYQAGVPKGFVIVLSLLYILAPYNIVYSSTMWKDVPFGGATLLFTTAFFRILRGIGKKRGNYFLLAASAVGFSVWRTNGWYALAASLVVFLFVERRKKKAPYFWVLLAILILCWVLLNPVLAMLGGDEMDLVEALAVPFQQISRYVAYDGWMDEYEREFLAQAFDLEKVKALYNPHVVDPVKFSAFRRENLPYIKENLEGYLDLYIQFGVRRPEIYLEGWIDVTKGYWGSGHPDPMYELGISNNTYGILQTCGITAIRTFFEEYFNVFQWIHILQPLYGIGLHVWVTIGCCVVNALKKRKEFLLSIPFIVLAAGLWFGSPVVAEFRYGYPMILAAPFLLLSTLFPTTYME